VDAQSITIYVAGYEDSDAQERADLAWRLEEDLRPLPVEDVSRRKLEPPGGAKGSAFEWAELIVTLAGSLPPMVSCVRGWLGRHPAASITLEINGDRLTLQEPSSAERRQLIEAWMKRHGG
jgi:hypothetical protein